MGIEGRAVETLGYISIPPYVFMAWYLVKYRDSFTITFVLPKLRR
jgi:hypothetical protein